MANGKPDLVRQRWRWARYTLVAVLLLGLAVGGAARFQGLGERQLSVDEYYFVQAVGFVLQTGLPEFPSGGYYVRGLLPIYLTAGSVLALGQNGLAYRLPAAVLSLLSVMLAYVYARRFMPRAPAASVALMMAVSSWQIEFAQFARMYSAFQCITLMFLLALDQAYFRGSWRWRYLPHILAMLATATHFLGVLLTPLLFVPLIDGRRAERLPNRGAMARYLVACLVTVALCYAFVEFDFRDLGAQDTRPADYVSASGRSDFWCPPVLLWNPGGRPETNLALVGLLLLIAVSSFAWLRRGRRDWEEVDLLLLLLLAVTAAHQFVLSAVVLMLLLARAGPPPEWVRLPRRRMVFAASTLIGIGWLIYAVLSIERIAETLDHGTGALKAIWHTLFGWPQLYRSLYLPWSRTLPLLGLLFLLALAHQFVSGCRRPLHESLRSPAFVAIWIGCCLTLLRSTYVEIRYVFFIYPVLLCVLALSVFELVGANASREGEDRARPAILASIAAVVLFAWTSDFNPKHILDPTDDRVIFRLGEFERFRRVWYARTDFASPGEFVNTAADGSRPQTRIVVIDQPPVSYYLRHPHAVYYGRENRRFTNVSRARGTVDLWSDHRLLSRPEELRQFTRGATTVWLLRATDPARWPLTAEQVWGSRIREVSRVHVGRDEELEVVRVELSGEELASAGSTVPPSR